MVFRIQRYLEDSFARRGLDDPDQYAVRLANLYDQRRAALSKEEFLTHMARLRSVFFRSNSIRPRGTFEQSLLTDLDRKFLKKNTTTAIIPVDDTVHHAQRSLSGGRKTIRRLLEAIGAAIEARAIDAFWVSRSGSKLKPHPESIAQALLAVGLKGLLDGRGLILRELASGVGYVDVAVILSRTLHLIEVKILSREFTGIEQLDAYMTSEGRSVGWLMVMDARKPSKKAAIPERVSVPSGVINVITVDIHPIAPSKR